MGSGIMKPAMRSINSLRAVNRFNSQAKINGESQGQQQSSQTVNGIGKPVTAMLDSKQSQQDSPKANGATTVVDSILKTHRTDSTKTKQMASPNGNPNENELEEQKIRNGDSIRRQVDSKIPVTNSETVVAASAAKTDEDTSRNKAAAPSGASHDSDQQEVSQEERKEEKEEKKHTVYTDEERKVKTKEYLDHMTALCKTFVSITPRSEEQGQPYTKICRNLLLRFAKTYFCFKLGQIPYQHIYQYRVDAAKQMIEHKCVEKLCDFVEDGVRCRDFVDEEGKSRIFQMLPLKNALLTLLNFSDASDEMKQVIGTHSTMFDSLVQLLNDWRDKHLNRDMTDDCDKILKWCLSLIHNCAAIEENIPTLREVGVIQAVIPYMDSKLSATRLSAVSTLAGIVNEEEAELLQTHASSYRFMITVLKNSLTTENHKHLGWSAEELVKAVRQLARNDMNKKILVDEGALPLLVTLLRSGTGAEIKETLDCLWVLSFHQENKSKMIQEDGLITCLDDTLKSSQTELQHACHGILWSLREQLTAPDCKVTMGEAVKNIVFKRQPASTTKSNTPLFKGHIMLSYQWANQELIKRIVYELRNHDIPVWLDIDYMGGSTLQAMAQAVEDSSAVVIAMSQKYKDSPNTRAEAEYAFQLRKKIIPLIMQRDYQPDGWLGFILGSKLYYDFSGKYSFESRMEGLMKAVLEIKDGVESLMELVEFWPSGSFNVTERSAKLSELTGEEILFLHNVKQEAPEFFYRCLENKLGMSSVLDLARVSSAFADLSC